MKIQVGSGFVKIGTGSVTLLQGTLGKSISGPRNIFCQQSRKFKDGG